MADDDGRRPGEPDEGVADLLGDRLVDLVRVDAAHVIGLENCVERIAHDRASRLLTTLRAGGAWWRRGTRQPGPRAAQNVVTGGFAQTGRARRRRRTSLIPRATS